MVWTVCSVVPPRPGRTVSTRTAKRLRPRSEGLAYLYPCQEGGVRMSRPTSELCSFMRQKMLTHLPCISPMQCFVPMRDIPAN